MGAGGMTIDVRSILTRIAGQSKYLSANFRYLITPNFVSVKDVSSNEAWRICTSGYRFAARISVLPKIRNEAVKEISGERVQDDRACDWRGR